MIDALINGILNIVIILLETALVPIDTLINTFIPSIADSLSSISAFFDTILGFIPWILSWFHLPSTFLVFVVGYWFFAISVSLGIHSLKVVIAWYNALKL